MLVKCKECHGRGFHHINGMGLCFSCKTCKGKGGFDVPDNKELCPECEGAGTIMLPTQLGFSIESNCEKCYGTGLIDKQED